MRNEHPQRSRRDAEPSSARTTLRRHATALAALIALLALCVAVAQADPVPPTGAPADSPTPLGDPSNPDSLGGANRPDTDITPVAKQTDLWQLVAGARFGDDYVSPDSATSFTDSLVTVAFLNTQEGFAGGSEEVDCPAGKVRVPVIYRFVDAAATGAAWQLSYKGDCDHPGYVGAIAWIAQTGRVVAVGGTGSYPEREPAYGQAVDGSPCPTDAADAYGAACDQAGSARAWEIDTGEQAPNWSELDVPSGMRGLTAVDFAQVPGRELGFAGGLGQLWRWDNGRFTTRYDMHSDGSVVVDADRFVFRVRQIRFVPGLNPPAAIAVTDGCCGSSPLSNGARFLYYSEISGVPERWYVDSVDPHAALLLDSCGQDYLNIGQTGLLCPADNQAGTLVNARQDIPDGAYSLAVRKNGAYADFGLVLSPGGPPQDGERASVITQPYCAGPGGNTSSSDSLEQPDVVVEAAHMSLSTARLVSGDGDVASAFRPFDTSARGGPGDLSGVSITGCHQDPPDAVPDWVVGQLRSTQRPGLGAQALAVATTQRPALTPDTVNSNPSVADVTRGDVTSQAKLQSYLRSEYFLLPSYALNAVDVIDPTGAGWAVGEHGAILHLGASGGATTGAGAEPPAPTLGDHTPQTMPDNGAYGPLHPLAASEPGTVPALVTRPLEGLADFAPVWYGSPNPKPDPVEAVTQVVMSRDGAEGWAIGKAAPAIYRGGTTYATTLYHYDGSRWSRCDPDGIPGVMGAHPACSALAALYHNAPSGASQPAPIVTAARVPLETGGDPARADDFDVVAIASVPTQGSVSQSELLDYRGGRWSVDPDTDLRKLMGFQTPSAIAYSAPGDGWILLPGTGGQATLLHDAGRGWIACGAPNGPRDRRCDDPKGLTLLGDPASGDTDTIAGMVTAGQRVYLYGSRVVHGTTYPLVLYRDHGGAWSNDAAGGGYDPGFVARASGSAPAGAMTGTVASLAVACDPDGSYHGWAVGQFESADVAVSAPTGAVGIPNASASIAQLPPKTVLMRLSAGHGWAPFAAAGPLADYVKPALNESSQAAQAASGARAGTTATLQATLPGGDGAPAFIAQLNSGRLFGFDGRTQRWALVAQGRPTHSGPSGPVENSDGWLDGPLDALAPDGRGGVWAAVNTYPSGGPRHDDFVDVTRTPHRPVFEEAPNPLTAPDAGFTALAGAPDGVMWAGTGSATIYRYDRLTGWDGFTVPGWDPGRLVTAPSPVHALALGPDGTGVAVGKGGRIADLLGDGVVLDAAAGAVCAAVAVAPCGTARDLRAAAVAPDGSALVGGDARALLWRPAGGEFAKVKPPQMAPNATITGVALPAPDRAWLVTDGGLVFAGTRDGGSWSWAAEAVDAKGSSLARDAFGQALGLRAVAIDAAGHGYAVGDAGLVLERAADGSWKRLATGFLDDLTAVALPAGGAPGALVGGHSGLVLTLVDGRLELARPADRAGQQEEYTGTVVGLAVLPGERAGQVEAWAALEGLAQAPLKNSGATNGHGPFDSGVSELLHYSSDASDPLLDGGSGRARPLPDAPAPRPREVTLFAFGKTDCRKPEAQQCFEMAGSSDEYEVLARRAIAEIIARAKHSAGPSMAVFTGDAVDTAGSAGYAAAEPSADINPSSLATGSVGADASTTNGPRKLRRWEELIAQPFLDAGVPLFGAVGAQDLADLHACDGSACATSTQLARAGENVAWRRALAAMPAPWGASAPGSSDATQEQDVAVPDPTGTTSGASVASGGANTHYAVDVQRDGKRLLRVAVVDTSQGSLTGSDPFQQPLERTGQLRWLDAVLSSRPAGEAGVVVSSVPTYSYGPGALSDTESDGTALESILLKDHVSAVLSGRLGWNALYWATAAGLHYPCPGGTYPDPTSPPAPGSASCQGATAGATDQATSSVTNLAAALEGLSAPGVPGASDGQRVLPVAIASSAGGKFGPDGTASGTAGEGYWHGYTVVRVAADGDPARTIVEQRPVLDWLEITAATHALRPGQHMTLEGFGREPIGSDSGAQGAIIAQVTRYDQINSPAITHRYDLLEADPTKPYLPKTDPDGNYIPLDPSVGYVDRQTGKVQTGKGNHGRVYAIALLSLGDKAASWPLVFEPRRSFVAKPPNIVTAAVPPALHEPPLKLLGASTESLPTTPPATPPVTPTVANLTFPAPPALPSLPTPNATPVNPPAPPAPPPPPASTPPSGLSLLAKPVGLNVAPPTSPVPPPSPPINPAPPGGARKEARQRQAAAAKSEEGANDMKGAVDTADAPPQSPGAQMTRRDRIKPGQSFTPLTAHAQPSAWTTGLEWGGGIGLMALVLALGYTTVRPTPRTGSPDPRPAPARATTWRRRT